MKLARIHDDEILPVWGQKFGRLLLRDLELPEKGQILEVACGTGYVTTELLLRLSEGTRMLVEEALIESERALGPLDSGVHDIPHMRNARGEATAELDLEEMVEIVPDEEYDEELPDFVNPPDNAGYQRSLMSRSRSVASRYHWPPLARSGTMVSAVSRSRG